MPIYQYTNLTVSAWVKVGTWTAEDRILQLGESGSDIGFGLVLETAGGNSITAFYRSAAGEEEKRSATISEDDEWIHVVMTRTSSPTQTLYINGVQNDGGTPAIGSWTSTASTLDIGRTAGGGAEIDAQIDDVAIWDVVLNDEDVLAIYNKGCLNNLRDAASYDTSRVDNLTAWWQMGDGTETGAGATIYDMSVNSRDIVSYDTDDVPSTPDADYITEVPAVYYLDSTHGICTIPQAHWDASDMNGNGDNSAGWSNGLEVSSHDVWRDRTQTYSLKQNGVSNSAKYRSGEAAYVTGFNGHPVVATLTGYGNKTQLNVYNFAGTVADTTTFFTEPGVGTIYHAGQVTEEIMAPLNPAHGMYLWQAAAPAIRIQLGFIANPDTVRFYNQYSTPTTNLDFDTNVPMIDKVGWFGGHISGQGTAATGVNMRYRFSGSSTVEMPSQTVVSDFTLGGQLLGNDGNPYPITQLGKNSTSIGPPRYNFAEMIFFNSGVSRADRLTIEDYLSTKYDIPDS